MRGMQFFVPSAGHELFISVRLRSVWRFSKKYVWNTIQSTQM